MAQYIYTMNRLSKVMPPKAAILRNITLSLSLASKLVFSRVRRTDH